MNFLTDHQIELRYYDTITIKHRDTKVFLHSHAENYPLRYEDGRISSQGMYSWEICLIPHLKEST